MPSGQRRGLPSFSQLPFEGPHGARSGWGLFGNGDQIGLLNLITPEVTKAAAASRSNGRSFPLSLDSDFLLPMFDRQAPRHTVIEPRPGLAFDDAFDSVYPQSGSHWDSLAHAAARTGEFYNGASPEDIVSTGRNCIHHWGARGIATRGVLLDVSATIADRGGPGESIEITVDDLEAAREQTAFDYMQGDILLIRTGFLTWYRELDVAGRRRIADRTQIRACGLERSERMAAYLWDAHAAGVASDTPAVEVWPGTADGPYRSLHRVLIGLFGMALGELWHLDDLARACTDEGKYDVLLVSAPTTIVGAIGSPANAVAIL